MKKTKIMAAALVFAVLLLALAGCSRSVTGSKEADNSLFFGSYIPLSGGV